MKRVLLAALVLLLANGQLKAASYLKTDGNIVDPIQKVASRGGGDHAYNGKNLEEMMDLSNSLLSEAFLGKADLTYTSLSDSNLSGANLRDANLTGSDLTGVNLRGANLTGVNLSGTVLKETDLSTANLKGAYYFSNNVPQWGNGMSAKNLGIIEKPPEATDRRDPKSTARAILTALRTNDFKTLWGLSNKPMIRNSTINGDKAYATLNPEERLELERYIKSLPDNWRWRWQAVSTWDGSIGKVVHRVNPGGTFASVEFGERHLAPRRQEVAVVHLIMNDGEWFFEDIHSPNWKDFRSAPRIPGD